MVTVLALLVAGCGDDDDDVVEPSQPTPQTTEKSGGAGGKLAIRSPATGTMVKGNVVTLDLDVSGVSVVRPDGDTSGRTGHFHVFIDKEPTPVGEVIPREPGVVHTADNPAKLYGLSVGTHDLVVVMGDGAHARLRGFEARTRVTVEGPSVDATAAASVPANQPIRLDLEAEGVEIAKPDGDRSGRKAHYHVFVDRDPTPAGEPIPPATPDNGIVHTADPAIELPALAPGEHVVWVVLGDGAHYPFDPPVVDRLTVTVLG